jgi:glutamate carboxypeptidase
MVATRNASIPVRALLAGARLKELALLEMAQQLVRAESPTDDKAAVDACVALAADHAKTAGG